MQLISILRLRLYTHAPSDRRTTHHVLFADPGSPTTEAIAVSGFGDKRHG